MTAARREVRAGDVSPGDYVLTYGREVREVRTYESGRAVAIMFTGSDGMSARHLARDVVAIRGRAPAVRRVVPIGGREPCPHGRSWHRAAYAVRTGDVRGVTCETHIPAALRDHARALRILARMT